MSEQKLSGSIGLHKMKHAILTTKSGVKGIFLPIAENKLIEGKDGTGIYLNFQQVIKDEEDKYGNCGFIAKRVDMGKKYADLTDAEKEAKKELEPVLGNLKDFSQKTNQPQSPVLNSSEFSDDDLPF